jgi:NAD(P)-dependent dehydrogenase (short-subunit alcohol dehydrogenase family)
MNAASMFDLTGKRALVSGGTGLGRQFALNLAGAGAEVVLGARCRDPLKHAPSLRGSTPALSEAPDHVHGQDECDEPRRPCREQRPNEEEPAGN